MTLNGSIQIAVFLAIIVALARPLGGYLMRVAEGERHFMTPVLGWLERGFYAVAGVDPKKEQSWLTYAVGMLVFKGLGFVLLYAVLRLQTLLPLNPAGQSAITPDLAFNTGSQLPHQHQLAVLWRRDDDVVTCRRCSASRCRTSCLPQPALRSRSR